MSRKLEKFVILFDNTNLLYFPGQFLSGRVLVELKDDTQALGLHFHVIGEGVVRLKSKRRERIYDKENYIDFRMRLLGEPGQPPVMLSPGIHSFPFKLGLPPGLPSTFLGKSGWVQYYCKAALREPNSLTHKNQQVFIVMNPIDLNTEPSILSVVKHLYNNVTRVLLLLLYTFHSHFYFCLFFFVVTQEPFRCDIDHKLSKAMCLGSGVVECQVCLDKGAYVPGETIEITATVTNNSGVTIKSTRATLTETIQYFAKSKIIQSETRELASLKRDKIRPNEMDQWHNEQLYVPPLPPTNLRGCHLINIQYDIYFIISPNNMEKDVKLQLPIMMGTYPFRTEDGSFDGKLGTHYPSTLPILRPWLEEKTFK